MVRFENVGLRYGLGPEVLRDLTFRIEPHSFQFLTGPSGADKPSQASTTCRNRAFYRIITMSPDWGSEIASLWPQDGFGMVSD